MLTPARLAELVDASVAAALAVANDVTPGPERERAQALAHLACQYLAEAVAPGLIEPPVSVPSCWTREPQEPSVVAVSRHGADPQTFTGVCYPDGTTAP